MVYFHIIYIEMQISFVVHVLCFLCLGREPKSAHHRFPSIRDPRSQIPDPRSKDQQIYQQIVSFYPKRPFSYWTISHLNFIVWDRRVFNYKSGNYGRVACKNDLKSLLQWKTTENCTNMNVLSFYNVKAKSLESLKLAHIVRVQQMPKPRKQKVLGRKKPRPSEKYDLGPASGQFMEEFLVQHLTWFLVPHTEQKGVHISIWG